MPRSATPVVEHIDTTSQVFPMLMPWGPDVTELHVIVTQVRASDGTVAQGFTWTPGIGARAIQELVVEELHPLVEGRPAESPAVTWDRMAAHLRHVGGGGISTLAMASVDIALWDLRARLARLSMVDLIGRRHSRVPVYASGVNRHLSLPELEDQVKRWAAAGHRRCKIKVGLPDLADDVRRVAAVRRIMGPDAVLMLDANQLWDLPRARQAMAAFAPLGPFWIEEPLPADDLSAYAAFRKLTDVPVAGGESLYTLFEFRDVLVSGGLDYLQPNICRVGGITPYLRIIDLARSFSVPVVPHLLPELSGQLALCSPTPTFVEDIDRGWFEDLGAIGRPSGVTVADGYLRAETGLGHGLLLRTGRPPLSAAD